MTPAMTEKHIVTTEKHQLYTWIMKNNLTNMDFSLQNVVKR